MPDRIRISKVCTLLSDFGTVTLVSAEFFLSLFVNNNNFSPDDVRMYSKTYTEIKMHYTKPRNYLINISSYFNFNDIIYKQRFGTSMGGSLTPLMANIAMNFVLDSNITDSNLQFKFI